MLLSKQRLFDPWGWMPDQRGRRFLGVMLLWVGVLFFFQGPFYPREGHLWGLACWMAAFFLGAYLTQGFWRVCFLGLGLLFGGYVNAAFHVVYREASFVPHACQGTVSGVVSDMTATENGYRLRLSSPTFEKDIKSFSWTSTKAHSWENKGSFKDLHHGFSASKEPAPMKNPVLLKGHLMVSSSEQRLGAYGPLLGQKIRMKVWLMPPQDAPYGGAFSWRQQAFLKGICGFARILGPVQVLGQPQDLPWRDRMRRAFLEKTHKTLSPRASALMGALLMGDRSGMDRHDKKLMSHMGVAHILALSGMHMALVAGIISGILGGIVLLITRSGGRNTLGVIYASTLGVLGVLLYLWHLPASAMRAYLMMASFFLYRYVFYTPDPLQHVTHGAFLLAVLSPASLLDVGCHLSFLGVLGLSIPDRPQKTRGSSEKKRIPSVDAPKKPKGILWGASFLEKMFGPSVKMTMVTLPVMGHIFSQVPLVGIGMNGLLVPLMAVYLMPLMVLHGFLMTLMPWTPTGWLVSVSVDGLYGLMTQASKCFPSPWHVPSITWPAYMLMMGMMVLFYGVYRVPFFHKKTGILFFSFLVVWCMCRVRPDILVNHTLSSCYAYQEGHLVPLTSLRGQKSFIKGHAKRLCAQQAPEKPLYALHGVTPLPEKDTFLIRKRYLVNLHPVKGGIWDTYADPYQKILDIGDILYQGGCAITLLDHKAHVSYSHKNPYKPWS